MELKDNHSHKGKILIANPFLQDPIFERSVILMVEHNDEGAMGFILNQPTGITIGEAFKQIKSCEFPVYYGGPIDNDILFYVHSMGDKTSNSIKISDNLYWGGDFPEICDLIKSGELSSDKIKFFAGYSGWSDLQLESEFEKESWIICDYKIDYVFNYANNNLWNKCLESIENELSFFSKFAHTPSLN